MTTPDHERRDPDVHIEFDREPTSPLRARRALLPLLSEPGDPIAGAVETVASELVSNVVQHTNDGGSVRAWDPKPDKPFHLEVSDTQPTEPVSPTTPSEAGGRGLRLVDELADRWGVDIESTGTGKTVWAEFNRPAVGSETESAYGEGMDDNELENKLTAWWLDIAPARQEDLLMVPPPPMPWFEESIADADLDAADVARFLDAKRNDPLITRDAGVNPKPD